MKSYLDIVQTILDTGWTKRNRTGVDAITVPGMMFEHDMATGVSPSDDQGRAAQAGGVGARVLHSGHHRQGVAAVPGQPYLG